MLSAIGMNIGQRIQRIHMETSIVCETSRLILRKFNENDVEQLLSFLGDPEVMRFSISGPKTREDIQANKAGLHPLISIIESENAASIRVAEKMGMTLQKRASFHQIPVLIYSVTSEVNGAA